MIEITLILIAATIISCLFWWAMIEAQTPIPGINEPGRAVYDDTTATCPQCGDLEASRSSKGDFMCEQCGLGCSW